MCVDVKIHSNCDQALLCEEIFQQPSTIVNYVYILYLWCINVCKKSFRFHVCNRKKKYPQYAEDFGANRVRKKPSTTAEDTRWRPQRGERLEVLEEEGDDGEQYVEGQNQGPVVPISVGLFVQAHPDEFGE